MACKFCNSEGRIRVMRYLQLNSRKPQGKIIDCNDLADCPKCNGTGNEIREE